MSVKSANLWSKIGFVVGCAAFLALLTADIDSYASTGRSSLPFGLHGQAIIFIVLTTTISAFVQVAIWRMRHQQALDRTVVREAFVELFHEVARLPQPKSEGPSGVTAVDEIEGLSAESIAIGRSISTRLNGTAH